MDAKKNEEKPTSPQAKRRADLIHSWKTVQYDCKASQHGDGAEQKEEKLNQTSKQKELEGQEKQGKMLAMNTQVLHNKSFFRRWFTANRDPRESVVDRVSTQGEKNHYFHSSKML